MRIFILSLGCDKNLCDTEHMTALLAKAGHSFTDSEEEAEVILVNSCCFIGDAKEESIREILRLSALKTEGKLKALIVAGCLSERYKDEFLSTLPEVDGIVGISAWDRIAEVVESALKGERPAVFSDKDRMISSVERLLSTGGHYAYLKIAEGCDKHCTYCVIPSVRGAYRSIPKEALLSEASALSKEGVKELILVAQETTLYGTDIYGRKALPELLTALSAIPGIAWIRLLYCYPEEITDEMIHVMKREKKVLPYLDMPIQHASDRILKAMNRKTTREEITARIRKIREEIPGVTLRTTLITGFPGETEADFRELCDYVKTVRFDRLGVFCYSKEEDTPASRMKGQIPKRVKEKRRNEIMRIQREISLLRGKAMKGRVLRVLVEGRLTDEEHTYVARSEMDAPDVDGFVFFESERELVSGDMVFVRVTASSDYDLIGEICDESAE